MKYYLFRHGETLETKLGVPYGDRVETSEILADGIPTIKKLANYLKGENIDVFFSSPYLRCKQTVGIIGNIVKKDFYFDERIGEEKINRNKEKLRGLTKRLRDFINDLKDKNYRSVAICSHGWPVAALTSLIIKESVTFEDLHNYPPPGVLWLIENKIIRSIDFNKN